MFIRLHQRGDVSAGGPVARNQKIVTGPAPVLFVTERREVVARLPVEASHLNKLLALSVEVHAEAPVWVVGRDVKPELLSGAQAGPVGIGLYHRGLPAPNHVSEALFRRAGDDPWNRGHTRAGKRPFSPPFSVKVIRPAKFVLRPRGRINIIRPLEVTPE